LKKLEGGPPVPGWLVVAVIVIGAAALLFVSYRALTTGGPRDPKTFPKEAYLPPGYGGKGGQSPYGQRPAGAVAPSTSGGNPYGGAYGGRPGGPSSGGQGGYGATPQRPDVGIRGSSGGM
jgi:hypothetical protein